MESNLMSDLIKMRDKVTELELKCQSNSLDLFRFHEWFQNQNGNIYKLEMRIELLEKENECRKSECELLINSNQMVQPKLECLDGDVAELIDCAKNFTDNISEIRRLIDDLNNRMNLRTNALRNDLEDLKATVDSLDEMIDRNY
jgi:hypothetical protein